MRDEAVNYARMGIPTIPLWGVTESGACSCRRGVNCTSPAKHPRFPEWQKVSANPFVADGYFSFFDRTQTPANLGLRLIACGLAVIDVDSAEGAELLEDLVDQDTLRAMPAARTGRGMHYYVRTSRRPGSIGPGLEIKSENVVAPPSRIAGGGVREWLPGRELVDMNAVPPLPRSLTSRMTASEGSARTTSAGEPRGLSIISNETVARMLLDRGVSEELVNKHLLGAS